MRKWVGILLIVLAACVAAQVVAPVNYVHAAGCDPDCPKP
jgi:hypothetical protein